jgi:hypothetical protein
VPSWAGQGRFSSITRTVEELTVVCEAARIPSTVRGERGWVSLRVAGQLDFSLTGVIASITAPLAAAKVSVFVVSTFDTDYVLLRQESLPSAIACLRAAGHEVADAP